MELGYYAWIALKLIISFVFVLFFFQFSGAKRQFSQMTTLDLISNFILGGILSGFIYTDVVSLPGFLAILIIYFVIIYALNWLRNNTNWGHKLVVGVPTILISNGQLDIEKLKKMQISMTDFMSLLRSKDIHSLTEVKLAQIEVGGELTIVKKDEEYYALLLVDNGLIKPEALKEIHKDEKWLKRELKKHGISDINDVFCAEWLNDQFYIIKVK